MSRLSPPNPKPTSARHFFVNSLRRFLVTCHERKWSQGRIVIPFGRGHRMKRTQNNALCTIIFGKSFKIAMCLFCLIQKKLGHLMTPVIGHLLLLPSEYHSLHGRSQPTNGEFPANSINTAPNLFVTLPFEKKTLKLQKKCSRYFIPYKAPKPWQTSQKSPINEKKHEKPRLRGFQVLLFHGWHPIVLRSGRIELWPFVVYTNNPP